MTVDPALIAELKNELIEIRGDIKNLTTEVRAGDRGSEASVRLLAQAQEFDRAQMVEDRKDVKEALLAIRELTTSMEKTADAKVNAVRKDLERQMLDHRDDDAPHTRTLGSRISALESFHNKLLGAFALMTALGLTNLILFFTKGAS